MLFNKYDICRIDRPDPQPNAAVHEAEPLE